MSNIKEFAGLPALSFIGNKAQQDIKDEMVAAYLAYLEAHGEKATLPAAHPDRLILYAAAAQIYQALQYIDRGAKQNFLKYAYGDYLDNLAAFKKIERLPASSARLTLRFTLSAVQGEVIGIPAFTRVKSDSGIYFMTDEYVEIPAGSESAEVTATAYEPGTASNGIVAGEVKTIVDPVAYVGAVTNITASSGGADIESDDDLTRRVYEAPLSWSVAGPAAAYEYWGRRARADIESLKVYSPSATHVNIVFMLKGGVLPDETAINDVKNFLSSKEIRPLTDQVTVQAPTEVPYNVQLTYYIAASDEARVESIKAAVSQAIEDYKAWQRDIGRDINPSKIYQYLMQAGAKRIELTSPQRIEVAAYSIPKAGTVNVQYGGLEDD